MCVLSSPAKTVGRVLDIFDVDHNTSMLRRKEEGLVNIINFRYLISKEVVFGELREYNNKQCSEYLSSDHTCTANEESPTWYCGEM